MLCLYVIGQSSLRRARKCLVLLLQVQKFRHARSQCSCLASSPCLAHRCLPNLLLPTVAPSPLAATLLGKPIPAEQPNWGRTGCGLCGNATRRWDGRSRPSQGAWERGKEPTASPTVSRDPTTMRWSPMRLPRAAPPLAPILISIERMRSNLCDCPEHSTSYLAALLLCSVCP